MKTTKRPASLWGPIFVCLSISTISAQTLQITSPTNGAVVRPGQTVTVTVADSPVGAFQEVIVVGQNPIGFSQVLTAPPYQFSILIPPDISPRRYTITADGTIALGQGVSSDPITLAVERAEIPTSLYAEPSVLDFELAGDNCPLRVVGVYADGSQTDITESLNTTYASNDPSIATVSSTGIVTAIGPGTTRIVINGSYSVQVTVQPPLTALPQQKALHASQTQQFVALAMDQSMPGVVWSSSPVGVGSITPAGLYSAPATIASLQFVTVTATNSANNAQTSSASVTLYPPVSVAMAPNSVALGPSQTQQFAATIQNASYAGLIWSTVPPGTGSITDTGLYTAPATIAIQQNVTVTATSVADGTKSASATVTLNPPVPTLTSVSPAIGVQGTSVAITLTGTNFVSGATVATSNVGITAGSVTVVSPTQITATFTIAANAAPGVANIAVTTSGGTSAPVTFTVNPPPPTLTSISPATGVQASSVTVTLTGTNFVSGATVAIANTGVTVSGVMVVSPTQITATFAIGGSAAPGAANVMVTTSGGTSGAGVFTVTPAAQAPSTTMLTSTLNPALSGQSVTFTATVASVGGTATGAVSFYDGTTLLGSGTVGPGGQATFTTSALAIGPHSITASYEGDSLIAQSISTAVTQNVQGTPVITWANPADITFGASLGSTQLNATADVPGTLVYTPPAGTVLPVGNAQTLSVNFTPSSSSYVSASKNVAINVVPVTSGGSPANIVVTRTLARTGSQVVATLTISNNGGTAAQNVVLTSAAIGTVSTVTSLPQALGDIPAGGSVQTTVAFPGTVGASGASSSITVAGTYTAGSFSNTARITLP
jgi:hypothetical protein